MPQGEKPSPPLSSAKGCRAAPAERRGAAAARTPASRAAASRWQHASRTARAARSRASTGIWAATWLPPSPAVVPASAAGHASEPSPSVSAPFRLTALGSPPVSVSRARLASRFDRRRRLAVRASRSSPP
eukprot:scaffold13012_cov109-Isochrysis_galbana.AAC.3